MANVTGTGTLVVDRLKLTGAGYLAGPAGGGFLSPLTPNFIDFLTFLTTTVQIPTIALPLTSPWPGYAFNHALTLTPLAGAGIADSLAVYNCATHILFGITPDQSGQTYFAQARSNTGFGLNLPSTGLVAATSDQATSTTLASPDWAKGLTVSQLDFYKTPWGRQYLGYIQSYGPSIVGLT